MQRILVKPIAVLSLLICCVWSYPAFALDLCELDMNIQSLREQRVRVSAFIREGMENTFLYDPKCQNGEPLVHFELKSKVDGKLKELKKIIKKRGYAFVTVEGIIHGPEPVQIDDSEFADKVRAAFGSIPIRRYGHFNTYKMEIEIDNVIEAMDPKDVKIQIPAD